MPVYDYECERCGPFTWMRPMSECDLPAECPRCGDDAPRAFLTAPHLAMATERRLAYATNEKSAHMPRRVSDSARLHGAGCGCCGGQAKRTAKRGKNGAKGFPTRRPWMISH